MKRAVIENMYVTLYLPLMQTECEWENWPAQVDIFHVFKVEISVNVYITVYGITGNSYC